jgi:hypothetical protein
VEALPPLWIWVGDCAEVAELQALRTMLMAKIMEVMINGFLDI